MDSPKIISFNSNRRFGVEIEVNSFDSRDFQEKPLDSRNNEMPKGILEIAESIYTKTNTQASVLGWHYTHDNNCWVLKPDRSCGMELCSPVMRGWDGLKAICEVVEIIKTDDRIPVDDRCSLHVHVEVEDLLKEEVAKILTYWIKCESIFLDSVPEKRKKNRYCQCIGMTDLFEHDSKFETNSIIRKLGSQKYYTINCYHYYRALEEERHSSRKYGRKTVEFRIGEAECCSDPFLVKNWVRLLLHFVETAKNASIPKNYQASNPFTGFSWLDLEDVFNFLGFSGELELSKGMEQTRNWFLARLYKNIKSANLQGIWSEVARKKSKDQLDSIINKLGFTKDDINHFLNPDNVELLYSNDYVN